MSTFKVDVEISSADCDQYYIEASDEVEAGLKAREIFKEKLELKSKVWEITIQK